MQTAAPGVAGEGLVTWSGEGAATAGVHRVARAAELVQNWTMWTPYLFFMPLMCEKGLGSTNRATFASCLTWRSAGRPLASVRQITALRRCCACCRFTRGERCCICILKCRSARKIDRLLQRQLTGKANTVFCWGVVWIDDGVDFRKRSPFIYEGGIKRMFAQFQGPKMAKQRTQNQMCNSMHTIIRNALARKLRNSKRAAMAGLPERPWGHRREQFELYW